MSIDEDAENLKLAEIIAQVMKKLQADGREAEFTRVIQDAVEDSLKASADSLFEALKHDAPAMLAEHRGIRIGFEQRLYERWGPALDLFETVLVIAQEAGGNVQAQHRERAAQERDILFGVLVRLHVRACQTASEVLALLRSGFAMAAMARWRTIHELAVVMTLLSEHGKELAQRYLDYQAVERAKNAEDYQLYHAKLGFESYTTEEIATIRRQRDIVLKKYELEPNFRDPYGWAAKAICIRKPQFKQLEKAAKLDHLRPFYGMASHGIHSQSGDIFFQLGQIGPERVLIAGASNGGLADPGHSTLNSLALCTAILLGIAPDLDTAMTLPAMSRFVDEAGQAFLKIHQELVQEEEELQASLETDKTRMDRAILVMSA